MTVKWHDVEQNQETWFQLRAGKITMSELHKIMASAREFQVVQLSSSEWGVLNVANKKVYKKAYKTKEDAEKFSESQSKKYDEKEFGTLAKQYAINLAIEKITGEPVLSSYSNANMERGHIQESAAREIYQQQCFVNVDLGGFYCNDEIGYSPDGLVDYRPETRRHKGAIEILSCISSVHFENIERKSYYPPKKWQLIGAMKYAELDWIDFVSYCEDFPEGKQLFIKRIFPEEYAEEFKMIDERIGKFRELIAENKRIVLDSEYFL